jgi:GTP-binding protein
MPDTEDHTEDDAEALEKGRLLFAKECDFVLGAATLDGIPPAELPEVAFAGRSNAGKSSLLNALTGRNYLARVSVTPGRTRQINFFRLGGRLMLTDLPGYGFAKVSKAEAASWNTLIFAYLRGRPNLRRVALIVDSRRGLMKSDFDVMDLLDKAAVSYQLVLTKADKLKPAQVSAVAAETLEKSKRHGAAHPEIMVTSSLTGFGIPELRAALASFAV